MKKLLILMLVFGITSVASAALQISVNGDKNPVDSQINIKPSDHLVLDIWTDAAIPLGTYFAIVVDTTKGSITTNQWTKVPPYNSSDYDLSLYDNAANPEYGFPGLPPGENGVWGGILVYAAAIPAGATLYDNIDFHCVDYGDAIIHMYETDFATSWLVDTVVIHQIPEPATMLLLGLGGLLLRRRK